LSKKYIPLYTKYRPMVFADITGQESTVKALSNAIVSGRIMHAYLFCGPRGTGKTSSARIFAKSLNCVEGPTVTPCGKCPGCLDVINSTPVDVIEIDAASNRSVEDARNILEKVQYAPLHGKYKIYIIDEVHMLTTEASNTLLKTLEEPPENVIFILATTESHKVLETIVSRCQRYDFRRITTADIVKRLKFIANSESIKIDDEALLAIAKNAAGGMRDAVALLDQLSVLGQNDTISVDDVNEILGQISYDKIYEIAECIYNNDTEQALKILNDIHDRGNEPGRVLTTLIQYLRDMLIVKSCNDKNTVFSMTKVNEALYDKIKEQSEKFENQTIIWLVEKISAHFAKIKENTNKFMWAELCIIDITSTPKIPSVAELTERIAKLEAQISSGNITPKVQPVQSFKPAQPQPQIAPKPQTEHSEQTFAKQEPQIAENKQVNVEAEKPVRNEAHNAVHSEVSRAKSDMVADWKQIAAEIKGPAKFFFSNLAKPIEINSHKIVIGFSSEGAAKQANDPSKRNLLQTAACNYFDVATIQIVIKTGTFEYAKQESQAKPQETLTQHVENFPEKKTPDVKPVENKAPKEEETDVESSFDDINQDDLSPMSVEQNFEKPQVASNFEDISDTAKNILNLFDGKIAEN